MRYLLNLPNPLDYPVVVNGHWIHYMIVRSPNRMIKERIAWCASPKVSKTMRYLNPGHYVYNTEKEAIRAAKSKPDQEQEKEV